MFWFPTPRGLHPLAQGNTLGCFVAATLRCFVAATLGCFVAATLGYSVAATLGRFVAATLGCFVAATLGRFVAATLGRFVAATLEYSVAATLGRFVAATLGCFVAATLGCFVAATLGCFVATKHRRAPWLAFAIVLMLIGITGASRTAADGPVRVGLERLADGTPHDLRGKRLGLIVHGASVTVDGRHAIDVLRQLDLRVVRVFTPEHGLRGRAAAGEPVADERDPRSGLPVISLYGEHKKPRPQDLDGLDVLVFDLQDAGVRFYTYVSTLILCLEAAAEAGLDFVVLDRPNPLGGERIAGPLAAPRRVVPASFVNLAPGPLVHGLTLGEMARWINAGRSHPARLEVIAMSGWQRSMTWRDTGRAWVVPSPNLRSAEAALAYPGVALLEATHVAEGRGTETPFLLFGAPWLDLEALTLTAPGFTFEATHFTPRASFAARHPKYLDKPCAGFRLRVSDASTAEPYRLGLTLLAALNQQPGFAWRRDGEALTWLLGTPRVLSDLRAGRPVAEIVADDAVDHAAWRLARRGALLY